MKRMGWASSSLVVVALLLAGCGDDGGGGPKTLSENDFVDELNSICKKTDRDLGRIDFEDSNAFEDVAEVMQGAADELADLKPPDDLERDYDDVVENFDDTITAVGDLGDAVDDEDEGAIADAQDELSKLSEDLDELADSLGADDCVDVDASGGASGGGGGGGDTPSTEETTVNTPLPIDTTEVTDPPETTEETDPVETDPVETDPVETVAEPVFTTAVTPPSVDMTVPENTGGGQALEIIGEFVPPVGFEWATIDISEVGTPASNPVLASVLSGYYFGRAENASTGEVILVSVGLLDVPEGQQWSEEQLQAMQEYELFGSPASDFVTSPAGRSIAIATNVGQDADLDAGVAFAERASISVVTGSGGDVVGLIDAFFATNTMGG